MSTETTNKPTPDAMAEAMRLLRFKYSGLEPLDRERVRERAIEMIARRGGDVASACDDACEIAFGNVSLAARASMAPTADFLVWLRTFSRAAYVQVRS